MFRETPPALLLSAIPFGASASSVRHSLVVMVIAFGFSHSKVDSVQEYEWVHRLQGPVLPRRDFRHNLLTDFAHQFRALIVHIA